MRKSCLVVTLLGAMSVPSLAIINGFDAPEFTFVGQVNGASGVVVAPNWVLTAQHVGSGVFTLNGVNYTPDQAFNADGTGGIPITDLTLMHFTASFSTWSSPYYGTVTGQLMTMVGFGGAGSFRADGTGYDVFGGGSRLKGFNMASTVATEQLPWLGNASVEAIEYDLDGNGIDTFGDGGPVLDINGRSVEGGLAGGDSGGGFFMDVAGVQRLVGTNDFIFDAQNNNNNFDFGDGGGAIYLGAYQNWIEGHINPVPEPASMAALTLGVAAMLRRRRR